MLFRCQAVLLVANCAAIRTCGDIRCRQATLMDGGRHPISAYPARLAAAVRRDCPSGQTASTNATKFPTSASYFVRNADGSGGFVSARACVNQPGYGFNGRESERCPPGSFNAGDTYSNCNSCQYGFTTAGPGLGVAADDCGIAAGFGNVDGTVRPCPLGALGDK